jgi:hypothetical protein
LNLALELIAGIIADKPPTQMAALVNQIFPRVWYHASRRPLRPATLSLVVLPRRKKALAQMLYNSALARSIVAPTSRHSLHSSAKLGDIICEVVNAAAVVVAGEETKEAKSQSRVA